MTPMMRLAEAVEWFLRARSTTSCADPYHVRRVAALFSEHLGQAATVQDLEPAAVGSLARWLLDTKAPRTARRYTAALVSLWKWCESVGLAEEPPLKTSDLMACPGNVPKRKREKPVHQRRSEEELIDWLFQPEA